MSTRELAISKVPVFTGVFLGIQEGSRFVALAKFASDEAAEEFKTWAKENHGKVFSFSQEGP